MNNKSKPNRVNTLLIFNFITMVFMSFLVFNFSPYTNSIYIIISFFIALYFFLLGSILFIKIKMNLVILSIDSLQKSVVEAIVPTFLIALNTLHSLTILDVFFIISFYLLLRFYLRHQ